MRLHALLLSLLLVPAWLAAQVQPPAAPLSGLQEEGPHVLWEGGRAQVLRIHQGKVEARPLDPKGILQVEGLPPLRLEAGPIRPETPVLPMPERIAAVSDIHGNEPGLRELLVRHGIMDAQRRWTFGRGHLVVVGDVFDRGPGVTECLWLLRSLQAQAPSAGGAVHVLLGNHEAMVLKGDHRYVNPRYRELGERLGLDLATLYGTRSELGRWVRSFNALLRLGDILFVHGGPAPEWARQAGDLAELNGRIRTALDQGGPNPLLGSAGPLWYRGLLPGASPKGDASEEEVSAILEAFHVKMLVVGHSTQPQVTAFHQGRVMGIDAGLQHPGQGELWLWDKGHAYRGLRNGSRVPLP